MELAIVVAKSQNGVIGQDGGLPWRLSDDLKYFKQITLNHPVIMGRNTFASIGKPLPQRQNIVLTHQANFEAPGCIVVHSVEQAIIEAQKCSEATQAMVIGGGKIYAAFLPFVNTMYVTEVDCDIEGDTFFPSISAEQWRKTRIASYIQNAKNNFSFTTYVLERHERIHLEVRDAINRNFNVTQY